ncbi:AcrR family transcriptional regulator [Kribbella aluminosa]|uniref:AcrR family transcriptional regulator n=1 Tax=Kribbella aluminosa TaxID=416017 RepID=A0ABS4UMR1_9ACTN|nr:TetR/AcrR family transcriptional regulator [Kribbella aluminosa]MBP2352900.1 AcrR family transcriptional regulator [Kribbella aluminosa]
MTTAAIGGGDRADARRNRAKMLTAAGAALSEQGLDVPLGEIARRAGVGAGTVYRHFPTKQALLEAVFVQHLDELISSGERRMAQFAPTQAFFGFLLDVVEKSHKRGHICDVVAADAGWPHPMLTASVQRFRQVLTALLHAGQRAGGVRSDLRPDDVVSLAVGCASMLAAHSDRSAGLRLVQLVLDSLRPSVGVTERQAFRDDLGFRREPVGLCADCGATLPPRPTGRPAQYCGATCRQRARRRRLAG